ncbi:hypothetical protein CRENBAI_020042 [Crenichthys baileyi]|uniref:Uncharacterized protein n=1 Tax=Crenichthys baileyi TaxID=28760 RepID=A0AAV9RWY1_9TELE
MSIASWTLNKDEGVCRDMVLKIALGFPEAILDLDRITEYGGPEGEGMLFQEAARVIQTPKTQTWICTASWNLPAQGKELPLLWTSCILPPCLFTLKHLTTPPGEINKRETPT